MYAVIPIQAFEAMARFSILVVKIINTIKYPSKIQIAEEKNEKNTDLMILWFVFLYL